jgi:hypothetical protein
MHKRKHLFENNVFVVPPDQILPPRVSAGKINKIIDNELMMIYCSIENRDIMCNVQSHINLVKKIPIIFLKD